VSLRNLSPVTRIRVGIPATGAPIWTGLLFASHEAMANVFRPLLSVGCLLIACDGTHGVSVGPRDASQEPGGDAITTASLDAAQDAMASKGPDAIVPDNRPASTIVGDCTSDADCVLVLDYRAGFECWWPVGASLTDLSRDLCLLRWTWTPGEPAWCATATPPSDCPGGDIPVMHSCPASSCIVASCNGGKCVSRLALTEDGSRCATTANSPPPVDCGTLRSNYFIRLQAAQVCDPTKQPTTCFAAYTDGCGCPTSADSTSPQAAALSCARAALENANCGYGNCGSPCPVVGQNSVCVPNATGSMGACTLQ